MDDSLEVLRKNLNKSFKVLDHLKVLIVLCSFHCRTHRWVSMNPRFSYQERKLTSFQKILLGSRQCAMILIFLYSRYVESGELWELAPFFRGCGVVHSSSKWFSHCRHCFQSSPDGIIFQGWFLLVMVDAIAFCEVRGTNVEISEWTVFHRY